MIDWLDETVAVTADEEIERALLGVMTEQARACRDAAQSGLRPAMFQSPLHQCAFAALIESMTEVGVPDLHSAVAVMNRNGVTAEAATRFLRDVTGRGHPAMLARRWAEMIRANWSDRQVVALLTQARSLIDAGTTGDAVIANVEQALWGLRKDLVEDRQVDWEPGAETMMVDLEEGPQSTTARIDVPWYDLYPISGGFEPKQLIIVAGRTGTGKSAWAQNLLQHVAGEGTPAHFLSLELDFRTIQERGLAMAAQVPGTAIHERKLTSNQWGRVRNVFDAWKKMPLFVDCMVGATIAEVEATVARRVYENGVRIAVIDHAQEVIGPKEWNRTAEISGVVRRVKILADRLEIPIVLLAQLNRENTKRGEKRPQVSDLKDTGTLEELADQVILLHRPSESSDDRTLAADMEVIVGKHRGGPTGSCTLHYIGSQYRVGNRSNREA